MPSWLAIPWMLLRQKGSPDLFVATTTAVYSNAPVGCRGSHQRAAGGIATLFVAVVTVGKQGYRSTRKVSDCYEDHCLGFFLGFNLDDETYVVSDRWGNRPASLWIAEDFGC